MKKTFTLIELLIVIVVIVILNSIIIPNIANVKKKGNDVALKSNVRHIQLSTDRYQLDHEGDLPSVQEPTILLPQPVDFNVLYPDYEVNLPSLKESKYWIDATGIVWGANIDSPAEFRNENGILSWKEVEGNTGYQVFEIVREKQTSGFQHAKISYKPIKLVTEGTAFEGQANISYAVSAIDSQGNLSAPMGALYHGYLDTIPTVGSKPFGNRRPIARITVNQVYATTKDDLEWSYADSYDPDHDAIVAAEWRNKQTRYSSPGDTVVELRVQDSAGNWSEWSNITVHIQNANHKPQAVLEYSPYANIETDTTVTFTDIHSTDEDGDSIVQREWIVDQGPATSSPPNGFFLIGEHTVKLRVQDSGGLWSDWSSVQFEVKEAKPFKFVPDTPTTVPTTTENKYAPQVSGNGKMLTWYTYDGADYDVWAENLETGVAFPVANESTINEQSPKISDDGNIVVYLTYQKIGSNWDYKLISKNLTTNTTTQIYHGTNMGPRSYEISGDGKRISYASSTNGMSLYDLEQGKAIPLQYSTSVYTIAPLGMALNYNGTKMLWDEYTDYCSNCSQYPYIYFKDVALNNQVKLTTLNKASKPRIAANGSIIVWTEQSVYNAYNTIRMYDLNTNQYRTVYSGGLNQDISNLSISSDGDFIVWGYRKSGSNYDVIYGQYLLESTPRVLLDRGKSVYGASISSKGNILSWYEDVSGKYEIFYQNVTDKINKITP